MVNLFDLLPNELIAKISDYADSKTKRVLSLLDRRINAIVLDAVKCIRVFPPYCSSYGSHPSDIPQDILVKVIGRYPKLEQIILGPPKHRNGIGEFGVKELPYIQSLISHLESDSGKNQLSSVKRIQYREITQDWLRGLDKEKAKELNRVLLNSLGHRGLENVRIKAYHNGSILTETEIQPILNKSPDLKTFIFDGLQSSQTVSLSFANQTQLTKVKLLHWNGDASTVDSLKNCKELEELIINYGEYSSGKITAILSANHPWKLTHLELKGVDRLNDAELDAITKNLPSLECLNITLKGITDEGMELLGRNCPNLKALKFSNESLTNSGLDRLTQYLPHLETISFELAYNITEDGIAAIAKNCKNLRLIQVIHYDKIEKSGIDALSANCQDLKVVNFSHGGSISLDGLYQLVAQKPELQYVELNNVRDIEEEKIVEFYQAFPQFIKKIPYISSVKKLHNLTI
jgi:hypothetical protein